MLKLDIVVHPSQSEPKIEEPPPANLGKKWRFPWRINMLAKPKPPVTLKYEPPPPEEFKVFGPLDPETEFRSDNLAIPFVRVLNTAIKMYKAERPDRVQNLIKTLGRSWGTIYNYYRKRLRDRELRRMKRRLDRLTAKKPKGKSLEKLEEMRKERLGVLATPRKLFLPEKIPRKWKALEDLLARLDDLAAPKKYDIIPARDIVKVNSKALVYEITETVMKLAQLPARWRVPQQPPLLPGGVRRSALKAKCTERIEKLAQPSLSAREARKQDDDKYDPWVISPNALKYKPSARILELAKPLERE